MKKLIFPLFFMLFAIFNLATSAHAIHLKVGIYQNPPSISVDVNGKPQGLFADLLKEIARREQWELEYVADTWDTLFNQLKEGKIDLLTSISYSEERDKFFDFSNEPVAVKWGVVYLRPGSLIRILPDLHEKRVATLRSGIHGQNFKKISADFGISPTVVETISDAEAMKLLEDGKVDAAVTNSTFGYLQEENFRVERSAITFHPTRASFAAPQGMHAEVLRVIDNYIAQWRKDKSSIYYQTHNQWYSGNEYVKKMIPVWLPQLIVGGLLGGILLIAVWIHMLRRQVAMRTQELYESNRVRELTERTRKEMEALIAQKTTELAIANERIEQLTEALYSENQ